MALGTLIDFVGGLLVLLILVVVWWYHFRHMPPDRRTWRCVRWHGGGLLMTPRPMTVEEVTEWLGEKNNAEVGHIDHERGFVFYRSRGA